MKDLDKNGTEIRVADDVLYTTKDGELRQGFVIGFDIDDHVIVRDWTTKHPYRLDKSKVEKCTIGY